MNQYLSLTAVGCKQELSVGRIKKDNVNSLFVLLIPSASSFKLQVDNYFLLEYCCTFLIHDSCAGIQEYLSPIHHS